MLKPARLYIVNLITGALPPTKFYSLKSSLYSWAGVELGKNVRIVSSVQIVGSGKLQIGDNTFIGHFSKIIIGGSEVIIGENVDISSNVTIINGTHQQHEFSDKAAGSGYSEPIIIENGSWIGASANLIAGAHISSLSIIGAGTTVYKRTRIRSTNVGASMREL
ncbi:hypothetical protein KW409_14320 [Vibrio fluvialis]|nr:hypothetical protein [Vibrio fluvialis]